MDKRELNKAIWVNEERHEKVKLLAVLNKQKVSEWIAWVIDRAYESAEENLESRIVKKFKK